MNSLNNLVAIHNKIHYGNKAFEKWEYNVTEMLQVN